MVSWPWHLIGSTECDYKYKCIVLEFIAPWLMARFVPALAGPDAPAFINLLWLSHLIHQYNLSQDTIWVTSCTAHRSSHVLVQLSASLQAEQQSLSQFQSPPQSQEGTEKNGIAFRNDRYIYLHSFWLVLMNGQDILNDIFTKWL